MSFPHITRHRMIRFAILLPAALMLLAAGAACGGGDDDGNGNGNGNGNGDENGAPSADPITILLKDNFFDPKEITIPVDTEVEITVENVGTAIHNMHVLSQADDGQDFMSDAIVNPGAKSTFTVKLSKAKTYDFQCDYHLPEMVGTIVVK